MSAIEPASNPTDTSDDASMRSRVAEELEDLTRKYDECTSVLEDIEATVDALLDDPRARVVVLDGDLRITAMSRGMATVIGQREAVLGRSAIAVLPDAWPGLETALRALSARDGWRSLPVDGGSARLCLRRVSEDDRDAVLVVRFDPDAQADSGAVSP